MRITRRGLLKLAAALGALGISATWPSSASPAIYLRPPGAVPEEEFRRRCIRCFLCGEACPYLAISYVEEGDITALGTPYIEPRKNPCRLCMHCTEICPTGALQRRSPELEDVQRDVRMGVAKVNTQICYAYNGLVCGYCVRPCPLKGSALKYGKLNRPLVQEDACVGCGACEFACVHDPAAITVIPWEEYVKIEKGGPRG
jgi:MauM/NapG family ferredoxin protein